MRRRTFLLGGVATLGRGGTLDHRFGTTELPVAQDPFREDRGGAARPDRGRRVRDGPDGLREALEDRAHGPAAAGLPGLRRAWQDASRHIGTALGREGDARKLVAAAEASFADARRANPQFEGRTGMVVVPSAENGGFPVFAEVSAERTDLLDAVVERIVPPLAKALA